MKIDFAMLTPKDVLKVRLMTFINDHSGQFNLAEFAAEATVSYSRAYHVLLGLRADLQRLGTTSLTKDRLVTTVTIDQYRHWLYVNSIPYQVMVATLKQSYQQTSEFCAEHEISLSTFNRRLRAMKVQLGQYNLQLVANPLRVTGNETLIQLLYFMLFSTTLTTPDELPELPQRLRGLHQAMLKTYANDKLYQDSVSLQERKDLLIRLALLRLDQGYRYAPLRFPLAHLTDLRALAGQMAALGDTPQQALSELATLDYLLTSSPYFVRALQPAGMQRLYVGLKQRVGEYTLAPGVVELQDYATGKNWFANWLFALCQFMLLFRVDPLLRPEITSLYQPTAASTAPALAIAQSMSRLYPGKIGAADLRLVQKYLSKYTNGLTLTAARVEILVTYDMMGVTTDIFNRLLSGIVHLSLLTDQTVVDAQHRSNYLVLYGTDTLALQFAKENQLEVFHWIKEIDYGENIDRLIKTLRHHELSLFALDFNNKLQKTEE